MSEGQDVGGVDGVGPVLPGDPLRPPGGAQDAGDSGRRGEPRQRRPAPAPAPAAPPPPPAEGEPGHRIDERA